MVRLDRRDAPVLEAHDAVGTAADVGVVRHEHDRDPLGLVEAEEEVED